MKRSQHMNQLLSTVRRFFKFTKNEKAIIQNELNRKEIMDESGSDQSQGPCGREASPGSKSSCYPSAPLAVSPWPSTRLSWRTKNSNIMKNVQLELTQNTQRIAWITKLCASQRSPFPSMITEHIISKLRDVTVFNKADLEVNYSKLTTPQAEWRSINTSGKEPLGDEVVSHLPWTWMFHSWSWTRI